MYWKWFRDLTKQWITLSKSEYERYKNMYDELGIDDKNSITLNFDCSNITSVVKKMVAKKFKFKYTPKEDRWDEILDKSKSTYEKDKKKKLKQYVKEDILI